MSRDRVLVVDDVQVILDVIVNSIRRLSPDTDVHAASSEDRALAALASVRPHLVFLDLNLGHPHDGLRLCQAIRRHPATAETSIIVLTGDESRESEIRLLEAGADDFIRKGDFSPRLLVCRMHAVLRRSQPQVRSSVLHGPLSIDPKRREVALEGRTLNLRPREFAVLLALVGATDRAVTRAELGTSDDSSGGRAVDVHIAGLRRKLGAHSYLIETVTGVGYRISRPRTASENRHLRRAG